MNRSTLAIIACWIAAIALFLVIGWMQGIDEADMRAMQSQQ